MPEDIEKIKKDFVNGKGTLPELAKKYGISLSTLKKRSASEKWGEKRNRVGTAIQLRVQQFAEKNVGKKADVLGGSMKAASMLNELIIRTIGEAEQAMRPADIAAMTTALEKNVKTLMTLYRIPDLKTEADLKRLKFEEEDRQRDQKERDEGIRIVIDAPEEGLDE